MCYPCRNCGSCEGDPAAAIRCPRCGEPLAVGARACPSCGWTRPAAPAVAAPGTAAARPVASGTAPGRPAGPGAA